MILFFHNDVCQIIENSVQKKKTMICELKWPSDTLFIIFQSYLQSLIEVRLEK